VETFCHLAAIDSPSGEEDEMAAELLRRLKALGLTANTDGYGNVIANEGRESHLLLSAHMDTVEPGRGVKPTVEGERIVADGTTILGGDCKAGVAAILEAIQSVIEDGDGHIPIEACFTRQEEVGLLGARNLDFSMITARESIVFDGEGPPSRITSASPTYVGFEFEIKGRAAHAGIEPEKGLSAIRVAAEMIVRLPQGRLDDQTTFNVSNIEGGTTRNTVPETATVTGEFRSASVEALDGVRASIDGVLAKVRGMFPEAIIEDHLHTEFEAYSVSEDSPAVRRVQAALRSLGMEPTMMASGGGTDGNVFRQKGIDAVVVGMADSNMHTLQEFVTISEMVDAAHLCETLLKK
jgi:tripeptide aminopeptidase